MISLKSLCIANIILDVTVLKSNFINNIAVQLIMSKYLKLHMKPLNCPLTSILAFYLDK